ncbi:MAG: hypothetical protein ACLPKT_17770 [Methylocella sp.]
MGEGRTWLFVTILVLSSLVWCEGRSFALHGSQLNVTMLRTDADPRLLIAPGQTFAVSIGFSNLRGDADAHGSVLKVSIPTGFTLKGANPAAVKIIPGRDGEDLVWSLGTIPAGALPKVFDLDLQASADLKKNQEITIPAVASTTDREADHTDERSFVTFLVGSAGADLVIRSTLLGAPFTASESTEFTAEVTNLGLTDAVDTQLKLSLPAKAQFKSSSPTPNDATGNSVVWKLGTIPPAQSRSVTIRVTLEVLRTTALDYRAKLKLKFTFDASSSNPQINTADSHLEITRQVELTEQNLKVWLNVEGADQPGELPVGREVTYEMTYGNFGGVSASQVSLSLKLPRGLDLVSAEPPAARSAKDGKSGGITFSWDVGELGIGQSGIIRSRVHVVSVPPDGSLVGARISSAAKDTEGNAAFSLRYAERK